MVAIDAGSRFARLSKWMLDRRLWPFFALVLIFYAAVNFYAYGLRIAEWDLLLLSGFATLIVGLMVVRVIPQRMHLTLGRLANRRALKLEGLGQESLVEELEDRALRWAMTTALFTVVLVTAGFFLAFDRVSLTVRIPLVALEAIAGYVAGLHLGRMASYGALGRFLKQRGCGIRVWPGHVDGAAGLKPLGDFYFFQAMVTAIPAMFLAAWWLLIPLRGERYARWRDPYLGGLAVAITLEVLAFVVPLLWFHREMVKAKRGLLERPISYRCISLPIRSSRVRSTGMRGNHSWMWSKQKQGTRRLRRCQPGRWMSVPAGDLAATTWPCFSLCSAKRSVRQPSPGRCRRC